MRYQDYYSTPGVRETCHDVKQDIDLERKRRAVQTMADYFVSLALVDGSCYLVPAPQHSGYAQYTREIAKIVAASTGANVLDIVRCDERVSAYEQKAAGSRKINANFFLVGVPPKNGKLVFLDNVISTGMTYMHVNDLFDEVLLPLVFAVDYTTLDDGVVLSILNNVVPGC